MSEIKRLNISKSYYFVTQVVNGHKKLLNIDNIRLIIADLNYYNKKYNSGICAYVILPDHLHFIIRIRKNNDLSFFMHDFKIHSAMEINKSMDRKGEFWQARFYDHLIRDRSDLYTHLDYIHYNPLKHGVVDCLDEYQYSSFKHFVMKNYYENNWGAMEQENIKKLNLE